MSRKGETGGGRLVHPKGENSMACLGFSVGVSEPFRLFLSANGPIVLPCRASMQTNLLARAG